MCALALTIKPAGRGQDEAKYKKKYKALDSYWLAAAVRIHHRLWWFQFWLRRFGSRYLHRSGPGSRTRTRSRTRSRSGYTGNNKCYRHGLVGSHEDHYSGGGGF
jgi:hypothetical protein